MIGNDKLIIIVVMVIVIIGGIDGRGGSHGRCR